MFHALNYTANNWQRQDLNAWLTLKQPLWFNEQLFNHYFQPLIRWTFCHLISHILILYASLCSLPPFLIPQVPLPPHPTVCPRSFITLSSHFPWPPHSCHRSFVTFPVSSLLFLKCPLLPQPWSLLPHGIPSPPVPPPHFPIDQRRHGGHSWRGAWGRWGSQRAWRVGGGRLRAPRGPPAPRQPPRAVQAGGTWPLPVSLLGRRGPDRGPCQSHSALRFSSPAAAEVAAGFLSRCLRRAMEKSSSCESLGSQPAVARPPSVDSLSR